jgi:hypothetical protein
LSERFLAKYIYNYLKLIIYILSFKLKNIYFHMGIGDWGLGIGDWGLGPIPNPQSPFQS